MRYRRPRATATAVRAVFVVGIAFAPCLSSPREAGKPMTGFVEAGQCASSAAMGSEGSRRIRTLIIPVDSRPEVRSVDSSLATHQVLVGGHMDTAHPCAEWHVLYSDGHRAVGAPANPLANSLVREVDPTFGEVLCGTVVIVGSSDTGSQTDVPDELLERAQALVSR